jgi:hypothetical protein
VESRVSEGNGKAHKFSNTDAGMEEGA